MAALPLSLTLSRFTNGLTRPFFGWVSDHIGRESTMALAFSLEGVAILVLFAFIDQPALFVVLTGLVFFGWGEIFSLFPSTLTDTFGPKFAATNYGFLYIAQGVGSILGGPAAAFLKQATGSWTAVFIVVAVLDALTALLAITVLRSMRRNTLRAADARSAAFPGLTLRGFPPRNRATSRALVGPRGVSRPVVWAGASASEPVGSGQWPGQRRARSSAMSRKQRGRE